MNRRLALGLAALTTLGLAAPTVAQEPLASVATESSPKLLGSRVATDTVLIARVDLRRAGLESMATMLGEALATFPPEQQESLQATMTRIRDGLAGVEKVRQSLIDAGAGDVYFTLPSSAMMGASPPEIIVPTAGEAAAVDLADRLAEMSPLDRDTMQPGPTGLVIALGGALPERDANEQTQQTLASFLPHLQTEQAVTIVAIPNMAARAGLSLGLGQLAGEMKQMQAQLPGLPDVGPSLTHLASVERVVFTMNTETPGMDMVASFSSPDAASEVAGSFEAIKLWVGEGAGGTVPAEQQAMVEGVASRVSIAAEANAVRLSVDENAVQSLAPQMLVMLDEARASALRAESLSKPRQIVMIVIQHASDNDGVTPADMDGLIAAMKAIDYGDTAGLLASPTTGQADGYVYVLRGEKLKDMHAEQPVVYERVTREQAKAGIAVGRADGSALLMPLEELEALGEKYGFQVQFAE